MSVLSITMKDLQILFKNRGVLLQLILLPLIFIIIFSGALASLGATEEDTRVPLTVVNLDGSETASLLLEGIENAGGVELLYEDQDQAMADLDEKNIVRVLLIPEGFGDDFANALPVTLRLISHPDADPEVTEAVKLVVEGVAQDMSLESQLLASLKQMGDMQASAPEEFQVFTTERILEQARSQFESSRERPLVKVLQSVPDVQEEREDELPPAGSTAVPGFTVLFIFLTGQTTARSIYDEKKVGSFRRLLAAPISKAALLAGKMLPTLIAGLIQAGVIFAFSTFGLRLIGLEPVTLGHAPVALFLVILLICLASSALGIVIAALARTDNQIGGLSSLLLWGMGIIGGSIIPLFALERFLGPLPKVVPHYWANRALEDLMIRGLGFGDVAVELAALLGFVILFFAIGLWRFDFE